LNLIIFSGCFFLQGKTGFPWIDANIAKLKQEGWIDYEARQSLAYFLTRGCLWINWEEGVKVSISSRQKRQLKFMFSKVSVKKSPCVAL
jgi:ABC-type sulfate transport system substrate-binding protein